MLTQSGYVENMRLKQLPERAAKCEILKVNIDKMQDFEF